MTEQSEKRLSITHAGQSDIGLRRTENQDAFGKFPEHTNRLSYRKGQLFIVADGLGGHQRGREASELAIQVIREYMESSTDSIPLNLKRAFEEANTAIYERAQQSPGTTTMGTTCVALLLTLHNPYIAHVGDSRVYRVNEDGIEQLTEDHSRVAEMVREGILTEREAAEHPSKSVLSRALGIKPTVEIDIRTDAPLVAESSFVLCSDGLSQVPREKIREVVLSNTPEGACRELIRLANEAGGHDNVTVQAIRIHEQKFKNDGPGKPAAHIHKKKRLLIGGMILLSGVIGFILYSLLIGLQQESLDETPSELSYKESFNEISPATLKTQLDEAWGFLSAGNLDSALTLFRSVLQSEPMDVEALQGVRRISVLFREQGENLRQQGELGKAVLAFEKAAALQPGSQDLEQLINLTRDQMLQQEVTTSTDSMVAQEESGSKDEKPDLAGNGTPGLITAGDKREVPGTTGPLGGEWRFPNLGEKAVTVKSSSLTFLNSPVVKKAIYEAEVVDIDIEVTVRILGSQRGRVGIIVGYSQHQANESYFLFTVEKDSTFVLRKCGNTTEEPLLRLKSVSSINTAHPDESSQRIKVKVLGPWIIMYYNEMLLNGWLGDENIQGKIGVYADANLPVEFSDFHLSSALDYEIPEQSENLKGRE